MLRFNWLSPKLYLLQQLLIHRCTVCRLNIIWRTPLHCLCHLKGQFRKFCLFFFFSMISLIPSSVFNWGEIPGVEKSLVTGAEMCQGLAKMTWKPCSTSVTASSISQQKHCARVSRNLMSFLKCYRWVVILQKRSVLFTNQCFTIDSEAGCQRPCPVLQGLTL